MTENHNDDDQTPGHGSPVTNGDAREMRRMYEQEEMSLREIARQFGISSTTVSRAIKRVGGEIREAGLTPEAAERGRQLGSQVSSVRMQARIRRTDIPEDSLGGRIRAARIEMGLSQVEFAKAVGVHSGTLSKMETNSRRVRPQVRDRIVAFTEKPPEFFPSVTESSTEKKVDPAFPLFALRPPPSREEFESRADQSTYEDVRNPHMTPLIPPSNPDDELVPFAGEMRRRQEVRNILEREAEEAEQKADAEGEEREALAPKREHESVLCFRGEHERCSAEWCDCPHHQESKLSPQEEIDNLSLEAMSLLVEKLQAGTGRSPRELAETREQIAASTIDRLTSHVSEIGSSGSVMIFGTSAKLYTRNDVLTWLLTMQYAAKAREL